MGNSKQPVSAGASLVLRHQQILWWVFAVNLILALLGGGAMRTMTSTVLDRSLASGDISGTLQIGRLVELLTRPGVSVSAGLWGALATQIVYLIFMLFLTGGILAVYRSEVKLSRAEFFENCGRYFWRMFRLMLISLIPSAICLGIYKGLDMIGDKIAEATPVEASVFWFQLSSGILVLLMLLFVRLWFDIAQVRVLAHNERSSWKKVFRAWLVFWKAPGMLLWMYIRISLIGAVVLIAGLWLWLHIPGGAFILSFLLLEVVILVQFAVRLWLRASCISWYRVQVEEHRATEVGFTVAAPAAF